MLGSQLTIPETEHKTSAGRDRLAMSLLHASRTNNLKDTIDVIDAGADVNAQLTLSGSALHADAGLGYLAIVDLLLKKGAGINAIAQFGLSPLQDAAANGHLEVVKLLLRRGAKHDQISIRHGTSLHAAASRGHTSVVKYLLKHGADSSVKAGPYEYALHAGAWFGSKDVVSALLSNGADMRQRNNDGCTALHIAAFTGHVDVLRTLLERGGKVEINLVSPKLGTALDAADNKGHYSAVKLLLDANATKSGLQKSTSTSGTQDSDEANVKANGSTIDTENSIRPEDPTESLQIKVDDSKDRKDHISHTQPKPFIHDIGFTTLHNHPEARVDIVFVHGLQGHPENTWMKRGEPDNPRPTLREILLRRRRAKSAPAAPVYWPYDLLSQQEDFIASRILTWGYDNKVIRELFGGSDSQNISQHGNNLMVMLQQERRRDPRRPLIFVCHSLGGIIVKRALAISKQSDHQPQYQSIYLSLSGIIFLGTPHSGSRSANWGLIATNLAKFALQRPSKTVLKALNPNSEVLENIHRSFLQMLEDGHFTIHSFYETLPMPGVKGLKGLIVPYESAIVGHARREICLGIAANHSNICKFWDVSDPGYQAVFGALQDYVREHRLNASN